jgi:hypothetical protein
MVDFKRNSMGLEKTLRKTVKNFHNVDLGGISGIGLGKWREIGWGELWL